jgi:hypothetical protein
VPDPNPEQGRERERRNFIEISAGAGMDHEQIALLLVPPITVDELRNRYATELEWARRR